MKLCKDCKYFLCEGRGPEEKEKVNECVHPKNPNETDLVFGYVKFKYKPRDLRRDTMIDGSIPTCGEDAKWFKEKPVSCNSGELWGENIHKPLPPPAIRIKEGLF